MIKKNRPKRKPTQKKLKIIKIICYTVLMESKLEQLEILTTFFRQNILLPKHVLGPLRSDLWACMDYSTWKHTV
ncbi:hypothetical protein BpHYR1_036058 [Brachionus plicatilis]|uniref:Uncharacterized protein n=1 Tax=Brachionus plicatilis TaxID=10195 RepID=A0A3M7RZ65_BRAPC|nr:hypothetical protein BpHYR1_036058 [Brachionus plicatilis]